MDQNEENHKNIQQQLFFKYFIESIQKQQQQDKSIPKLTEQSTLHPYLSTNNLLKEFSKRIQQAQEHLIHVNQQELITSPVSTLPLSDTNQSDGYSERRRKNNEAAKRSRDARRVKEDEIALRATMLEQENVKLRLENAHLKQENIQLRCQIYSSTVS